jgi:hypothetical protein
MNILDAVSNSPIIKDGKLEIAMEDQTIIELAIALFVAASLAILVYFLMKHASK